MNPQQLIAESTEQNLEKQYQYYLRRAGLNESRMSPTQRVETKRAFFAACGQMFILMRDGIGNIENENEAIKAMDHILSQVADFWLKETGRKN